MEGRESRDVLNSALCDELLAEILSKVSDSLDRESVSLVCKRWKRVQRIAKCRLGFHMLSDTTCATTFLASIASFLSQHAYITCLSIKTKWHVASDFFVARTVIAIASSCKCLTQLHFTAGPLRAGDLEELAKGCPNLCSLELLQPTSAMCLPALCKFAHLQELTLRGHSEATICRSKDDDYANHWNVIAKPSWRQGPLKIVKLALTNMRSCTTCDLRWLWCSCDGIQKLELSHCDVVGDSSSFAQAFPSLQEVKLLRCRGVAGQVLMFVAKHASGLKSLTVHDGADTEGLRLVLQNCRGLELLDVRLPLDLSKEDLMAIGQSGKCLLSLRLRSCWMASGADMQSLAHNINPNLEELVLVKCRAICQDPGTLSSIAQSLSNLKSIDLSENEYLADKELVGMLATNCEVVRRLNLWRCCRLTDKVLDFIGRRCARLESIDMRNCEGMSTTAVNNLLVNCGQLRILAIEPNKLSAEAKRLAFSKRITLINPSSNGFSP
ncbi:hypothetical protein GOP47_0006679 [Adiantum capillus-veneris]|uniref:COI1 F-box domain-containing protein n=1 Tax=Adiantum capillus-veneris TaxID=13818 RepID=A0A9D4V4C0_ADICA|nr:hypothetical protein GOP47_0006679 [Adiantum capillus-veneris]